MLAVSDPLSVEETGGVKGVTGDDYMYQVNNKNKKAV